MKSAYQSEECAHQRLLLRDAHLKQTPETRTLCKCPPVRLCGTRRNQPSSCRWCGVIGATLFEASSFIRDQLLWTTVQLTDCDLRHALSRLGSSRTWRARSVSRLEKHSKATAPFGADRGDGSIRARTIARSAALEKGVPSLNKDLHQKLPVRSQQPKSNERDRHVPLGHVINLEHDLRHALPDWIATCLVGTLHVMSKTCDTRSKL